MTSKLDELYKEYNECKINYIKDKDNPDKLVALKNAKQNIENEDYTDNGVKSGEYKPYPDYNNPDFIQEISNKREFNYNKNDYDKENNPCDTNVFELSNHQIFLKNFMNNKTPYKGLLLYHGVGTGKTCSAVTVAENFRDIYGRQGKKGDEDKRIIVLVPNTNVESGWRRNIFDINKDDEQCTGNIFLNELNELSDAYEDKEKRNKKVNKIINKYYDFYGYREFANKIERMIEARISFNVPKKPKDLKDVEGLNAWMKEIKSLNEEREIKSREIIKNLFSNRLIIVDEVHNLRSETKEDKAGKASLDMLERIVKYSNNLKLVLLSATPMFDNKTEILWFINILLKNDKREPINQKDIFDKDVLTEKGKAILRKKCRGYISYLRGENPKSFPIRLFPCDNKDSKCFDPKSKNKMKYPEYDIFEKRLEDDNKLKFSKLYFDEYKGEQLEYNLDLLKDIESLDLPKQKDLRGKSNICYPDGRSFEETFEKKGSVFNYKDKSNDFLDKDKLENFSVKMHNILKSIEESQGIIFIFSEFLSNGCIPMALVLERFGFRKYGNKNIFEGKKKQKYIDDKGQISKSGGKTEYPASYILLTGTSSNKQKEIDALRSDKNKNGGVIKVIIGSPTVAEGLDFKRIREVHIMDPWYNLNKIEQIIGRGIRFCSHNDLAEEYRNVTVYLHAGYMEKKESIDIHIYKDAERKAKEMGEVEKILKENAIDCYLNKGMNHIKEGNVKEIDIESSQGKTKKITPIDQSDTKICSFGKCEINCNNTDESKIKNDTSTINYDLLKDLMKKISYKISDIFQKNKQPFFSLSDICNKIHEEYDDKFDEIIIKKSLSLMIRNKIPVKNSVGLKGYLIAKSKDDIIYILFQPDDNKNENISLYRRRTNKKINRHDKNTIKKYYKNYKKKTLNKNTLNLESYINDKFNDIKKLFCGVNYKKLEEDDFNDINDGNKIYNNISEWFIYYIIDTIDKDKKESLYEILINEYDAYINDKTSLRYNIYNHLRLNFVYDKYVILDDNNKNKPIGYFYNNLENNKYRQKLSDIINKYTFKEFKDGEFNSINSYNKKSVIKSLTKNLKRLKITDKELYGYTINKDNKYYLKVYNSSDIHWKKMLPGNVVNEGNFKKKQIIDLIEDLDIEDHELDKPANEIYITINLIKEGNYLRYDLYLLSINLEDADENNPNK